MLNISEDGWFGKSIGPKQHFAHSLFRAIETGNMFESANNGMTAIINPLGEIEKKLVMRVGFIDFHERRDIEPTIFFKYGNILVLILLYIFLIFHLIGSTMANIKNFLLQMNLFRRTS